MRRRFSAVLDWTNLDKPGQEKNYEMCESRAEIKQDDIEVF